MIAHDESIIMKKSLTLMRELITIALAGKTEADSAVVQPAKDSQLGYRRNVVAPVSQMWYCRISRDISEIPSMPKKKPSCRRQGSLLTLKGICPIHTEPVQLRWLGLCGSSFRF